MLRALALLLAGGLAGCIFYLNPLCSDAIRNGEETDIDCGGSCGKCSLGRACDSDADCDNGQCAGGTCEPLPCENGRRDGDETDIDCGGGTCRKCAGARTCARAGDCFSGQCAGTCFSLETVSFAPAGSYHSGSKAYVLFGGDFNRDGRRDLASANELGSDITVFLGVGDGSFTTVGARFPVGDYPTGGAVADFNHDGIADIVTANYHGDSVSILLGVGDGTFEPATHYPTVDAGETSNLAVGDLDGDGNVDVVATNPAGGSVTQFMGRIDGTLGEAMTWGLSERAGPYSAAIGDFDADGHPDVAIADITERLMWVRLGNGDGSLGAAVSYAIGGIPSFIVIARDVDLDGRLDLVSANRGSDDVSVLLGVGDGTFRLPIVSSTGPGTGPYAIAVADFNLDGVPDVVTPNYVSSTASVLLGVGDGSYDAPIDLGVTGELAYGVVADDFDADGKVDIAICHALSNDVTVKSNTSR